MPEQKLKEIHTRSDDENNLFYLGYFLDKGEEWSLVQVIAQDCSLGSLMLIKNDEISEVLNQSANIDFVQEEMNYRGLLDVMRMGPYINDVARSKMHTLSQALNYSLSMQQSIILATKTGEELIGYVSGYNNQELRLTEIDYYEKELKSYDTVIPLKDIVIVHLFNEETSLMDAYFADASDTNFSGNLVELFLNFNDDRDNWPWVGVIAAQNDDYLLFEKINPVGVLSSLELIKRKFVYYVAKESSNLNYYRFIVALKQQLKAFDVDKVETRLMDLKTIPTFRETLLSKKNDELFTVNNQDFDAADTGLLTSLGGDTFSMSLINNMEFINDIEDFLFAKTISISIWSSQTAMMSSILKNHR